MGLRDRIAALERRAAGSGLTIIVVRGGLPAEETEPLRVEIGGRELVQKPDENENAFKARATAAALNVDEHLLVFGGLPI